MIKIEVRGVIASEQETEALYCGAQNVHSCRFAFDENWKGFVRSAVFRVNEKTVTVPLDEDDSCVLPWELLVRGNIGYAIEVGVYGVSATEQILTSEWADIGRVREGTELGSDAREPASGVYEQVMARVQRVDDKVTSYNEDARTLLQRAESAAEIAQNGIRDALESAVTATDAAATAKSALLGVQDALDRIPVGSTPVINDLTTGGAGAALSAEMGKTLARRPNPNLLHNWYFANPINQKGKTVYDADTYNKYIFDCWKNAYSVPVTLADGYVSLGEGGRLQHPLENGVIAAIDGVPTTFSALTETGLVSGTVVFSKGSGAIYCDDGKLQLRISGSGHPWMSASVAANIIAVKFELGEVQTLAHLDGERWELNEIPDYGEELRKCQRYYQLFSAADKRPAEAVDYRPTIRTTPKTGEIEINGVTHYYADANL